MIKHLVSENVEPRMKTVAKCVRGNILWAVHEYVQDSAPYKAGHRWIGCYELGADHGEWGYKDMDETMGPYYTSCPVTYFAMVPDPGGHATDFRARCQARADREARIKALKPGAKVKLIPGCSYRGKPLTEAIVADTKKRLFEVPHSLFGEPVMVKLRIPPRMIAEVLP